MSSKPISFKLPLSRFDVNLLPPDCRQVGTEGFKNAVLMHFAIQYAKTGDQVLVTVDDEQITVLTLPLDMDPFDFALSLLKAGKMEEAVPYLESITKSDPENVNVLYNLGIAYSELGQFDEAVIRLKKAVRLDPTHVHAWTGIGVAYQRMGKSSQALEPMQKAVEANPADGYAQRNLGAMLMGAGKHEEALSHFREARKALPDDPQTLFGLACVLQESGSEDNLDEADELFLVVIEKFPDSEAADKARTERTKSAHQNMRDRVDGGIRPDVVMYISGALDVFAKVGLTKAREITLEVMMKGKSGLDINDSTEKYTLRSLKGRFSGLHLVSIMYAGIKALDPKMDAGIDLQSEYEAAKSMKRK